METRYMMESKLKPLQIFLFVFFVSLLISTILTFAVIYLYGLFDFVVSGLIEIHRDNQIEKTTLIKTYSYIFFLWLVPALCAMLSWTQYKKIHPISYCVAFIIQIFVVVVIFIINGVNVIEIVYHQLFRSIVLPFLFVSFCYLFVSMIITYWLAKQIFDIKDRDIGIEIVNNGKLKKQIIYISIDIIIISTVIYCLRKFIFIAYLYSYVSNIEKILEFLLSNRILLLYLLIGYLIQIIPLIITLYYISYNSKTFMNMVYFTKLSLVINIIFGLILACASTMMGGVTFGNDVDSKAILSLFFFLDIVVFNTMMASLSFWLTMKITGTEGHLPKETNKTSYSRWFFKLW